MEHDIQWCVAHALPGGWDIEEWRRTVAVSLTDGTVYVPAILAGDERHILWCAHIDDEPAIFDKGHLYVSSTWLRQKFSDDDRLLLVCKKIEDMLREGLGFGAPQPEQQA